MKSEVKFIKFILYKILVIKLVYSKIDLTLTTNVKVLVLFIYNLHLKMKTLNIFNKVWTLIKEEKPKLDNQIVVNGISALLNIY